MAQYLNQKATFKCSECQTTVIRASDPLTKAKLNGEAVLTGNAVLYLGSPGPLCKYLTQQAGGTTPVPCAFPGLTGGNLSGADRKCKSGNSTLLTDKARGRCPLAPVSVISVSSPSSRPGFFKQFGGDRFSSEAAAGEAGTPVTPAAEKTQPTPTAFFLPLKNAKAPAASEPPAPTAPAASDEKPVFRCDNCEEADDCQFLKDLRTKPLRPEDNDPKKRKLSNSQILKTNYYLRMSGKEITNTLYYPILNDKSPAHKAYLYAHNIGKQYNGTGSVWKYAAHHIICCELFEKNYQLNILARAFDYNMNCADNCIMLITNNRQESLGGMGAEEKHSYAFEHMAWGRMQWHVGKHQYDLTPLQASIARQMVLRKYASKDKVDTEQQNYSALGIKCYLQQLKEKVAVVIQKYQLDPCCPNENLENRKKHFHATMNKLADEIRQELASFYEKPHRSYPWFVSKETWIYAFMLPHCMHIVSMLPRPEGVVLLERFNVTRYADTLKKDVDPKKVDLFSIKRLKNANGDERMFWRSPHDNAASRRFCADAHFFVLGEGLAKDCAGFEIPKEYIFRVSQTDAESALDELQAKQSLLLGRVQAVLEKKGEGLKPLLLRTTEKGQARTS